SMPRAIVSVTNDLSTDNRVHRTCTVLVELGYDVLLVGRQLPGSLPLERPYATRRMRLLFRKGAAFYAEYNLRLFFLLLFSRADLLWANDLDTLLANHLVARMHGRQLAYDSHEYFTEVPELQGRFAKKVWLALERWIFPKLKHVITVNASIAHAYQQRYGVEVSVVRNIPMPRDLGPLPTRSDLGLPAGRFILVMQGSGINVQRGAEEAVLAMKELPDALLLLIGGGDAWPVLERMVKDQGLADRVRLLPRMPYERMMQYTRNADLGLSLDKDTNLNYRFSLPNKLFDYFRAGIPALVSDLPEVAGIVREFNAGVVVDGVDPPAIAQAASVLMSDVERLDALRQRATFAASKLDGEREMEALKAFLQRIV
ncbi:MAG TPA: glycosyltransferase, partial [Flavobacteriales bacterium]|nr:glycosyltransferase [Flavobacteriales bacterium]